jgi:hypothetical protein
MLVLAGTLAFVVTNHDEDGRVETPGADRAKRTNEGLREAGASGAWQTEHPGGGPLYEAPDKPNRPSRLRVGPDRHLAGGQAKLRTDLKVQVKPGHPRHEELEASASRVESSALRHLEQLTHNLDLTAEQQARIFRILVRGAQSYDPGMQVVDGRGSNGTSTPVGEDTPAAEPLDPQRQQELIQEELDPKQADALVNLSIRDLMIWEELIGDLTRQLDQATPGQVAVGTPTPPQTQIPTPAVEPVPQPGATGGTGPSTPTVEPPAAGSENPTPPASHGGRNLFDLVPGE